MQPVSVPDLWDQLGFLVTKILGGDSHSIFSTDKRQEFLVFPHLADIYPYIRVDDRRYAAHVRQNGDSAGDLVDTSFVFVWLLCFIVWFVSLLIWVSSFAYTL